MAKPFEQWTVLPHGKLTRVDDDILTVTGVLHMPPMGKVERRMTVVRLADRRLVVYSAIALDGAAMRELEAFGTPAFLVVPNDIHRMDVKAWKSRYPAMTVIAPTAAREKVEEVVHVDATYVDFGDPAVRYLEVPGTGQREAALLVESPHGTTLVLNDLIFDLRTRPGIKGWLFEKLGMTGKEPHIPPVVRLREVKDKAALRAQLESWSRLPNLKRVVISHGDIIANDPGRVLERIAHDLVAGRAPERPARPR
jgi:hypothetical protein